MASDVISGRRLTAIAFHPDGRAFVLAETRDEWRIYRIDLDTGAKRERWILQGAESMESLVWSLDGTHLYSAADRDDGKDLVTIELADDGSEEGTVRFVSDEPSGYDDIESLAWIHVPEGRWRFSPPPTAVTAARDDVVPFTVSRPWPNPSSGDVSVRYGVPADGTPVRVRVYDAAGRRVRTLVSAPRPAGPETATWDGRDDQGASVAAGVYFYRVTVGGEARTRRVVRLR